MRQAKLQWHPLRGASMWPLAAPLQAGVAAVAAAALRPGDVVAFLAPSGRNLLLHRVVAVTECGVLTRGDTNQLADPVVPFGAVLGRLEALRCGPLELRVPTSGPLDPPLRHLGRLWSSLAPRLRQTLSRRIRGGRAHPNPPPDSAADTDLGCNPRS